MNTPTTDPSPTDPDHKFWLQAERDVRSALIVADNLLVEYGDKEPTFDRTISVALGVILAMNAAKLLSLIGSQGLGYAGKPEPK